MYTNICSYCKNECEHLIGSRAEWSSVVINAQIDVKIRGKHSYDAYEHISVGIFSVVSSQTTVQSNNKRSMKIDVTGDSVVWI